MRYQGSKFKMRKVLKNTIEPLIKSNTIYFEPFMGGCNSLAYINAPLKMGYDINKYVVALWRGLKDGTFKVPQALTEEEYYDVKKDWQEHGGKYSDAYIGYISMCCSYGSGFWNGYAKYNPKKNEDHIKEAYNGIMKQLDNFVGMDRTYFYNASYEDFDGDSQDHYFIYCDPPYQGTKRYEDDFNTDKFWEWCRKMIDYGHTVLVSEYQAPDDFIEIWSKEMQDGMGDSSKKKVEKMFVHKSQVELFRKDYKAA